MEIDIGTIIWDVVLGALAISAFFGSIVTTQQQTMKIIERFGKYVKTTTAGLSFKFPFIEKVAAEIDLRTQQLVVKAETKTKDNVFVTLQVATQYLIIPAKAKEAYYSLENPSQQITAYVLDTIRAKVPSMDLDEVFVNKSDIAQSVQQELKEGMESYGYSIVTTLVVDIDPSANVKDAMNQIQTQTRLREAANQKAEAEKILVVKAAEAEAEAKALQGKGIAEQRKNIIDGLAETAEKMAKGLDIKSEDVLTLILLTQYFDTIKEAGAEKVILMPHSPSGLVDLKGQIREAIISGDEATKTH